MAQGISVGLDLSKIEGYTKALKEKPQKLLRQLEVAFQSIAKTDRDAVQDDAAAHLNIRARGKLFSAKATDRDRAVELRQLFANIYTRWKGAEIFQTGGVIAGKGHMLTVLNEQGRSATGKRRFTQSQLQAAISSGKVSLVPTPRGILIVQNFGGVTKTGKGRKNSRSLVIGILKRQVIEKKRLNFYETIQKQGSLNQDILETAVENVLLED